MWRRPPLWSATFLPLICVCVRLLAFSAHKSPRDEPLVGRRQRHQLALPLHSPFTTPLIHRIAFRLCHRRRLAANVTVPDRLTITRHVRVLFTTESTFCPACVRCMFALRWFGCSNDADFLRLWVAGTRWMVLDLGRTVSTHRVQLFLYTIRTEQFISSNRIIIILSGKVHLALLLPLTMSLSLVRFNVPLDT